MLDLTTTFGAPGSVVTPLLRSFMSTFQVSIRNREANSSACRNMYVKAFDSEQAMGIASLIIAPYDMIVKSVMSAGSEGYGIEDISDADPLPLLRTEVRNAPLAPMSPFEKGKSIFRSMN